MLEHERLSRWLSAGRRRLRSRAAWRGAAIGGFGGASLAIGVVGVSRLVAGIDSAVAAGVGLAVVGLGMAIGAIVGRSRAVTDPRSVALVLDRIAQTDERLITAVHLGEADDRRADQALRELERVEIDALSQHLPVRWPRASFATPLLVALAIGAAWLPPAVWPVFARSTAVTTLSEAGERLQERLAEIDEPAEVPQWPQNLDREVQELADAMIGDTISEAEAADRLDELAEQVAALGEAQAEADSGLDALEEAAEALKEAADALDERASEALQEALSGGDGSAGEEALHQLQEALGGADAQTRERTAEAMQQAGDALSQQGSGELAGAGEALQRAAEAAQSGEGLSPQEAQELMEQLQQAREAGQQMQRDREALERAQELAGALEGARQQLGEGTPAGRSSQEGRGDGGAPGDGKPDRRAGQGHTWEDQGEQSGGAPPAGEDEDRNSERTEGEHIDDFEKFYDAVRLPDAHSVVAGTNHALNESGRVDEIEYRLTTAEESATVGRVSLPSGYREAASAAVDAEDIPPAYRETVKDYFAEMEP